MEECIVDTPWLTDSDRKILDIVGAFSLHYVRSAYSVDNAFIICINCYAQGSKIEHGYHKNSEQKQLMLKTNIMLLC